MSYTVRTISYVIASLARGIDLSSCSKCNTIVKELINHKVARKSGNKYEFCDNAGWNYCDAISIEYVKKVKVLPSGNRSVSIMNTIVMLKSNVTVIKAASFMWSGVGRPNVKSRFIKMSRLMINVEDGVVRLEPVRGAIHGRRVNSKSDREVNFIIELNEPVHVGEVVRYGIYLWSPEYYAMNKKDAIRRFNDEWVREGLAVVRPTIRLMLIVKLPNNYNYERAVVELNPILSNTPGFNQPGYIIKEFKKNQNTLEFDVDWNKTTIRRGDKYFISWIPP